jgi:threonine dehydrogenase-like Zn-dependent dehydrogenase
MKAVAIFPSSREVKLVDEPAPRIATPTDVRVRILDVGICGTDKELCAFKYGTPPAGSDHLVIGHESLGEVVEVGPGVSRVAVGDLVVPMVRRPCSHPECAPCASGRQDFCSTNAYTERGIKERHGFLTELVVDDERYLNVVPSELRAVGVLVEPLTIAAKALAQVRQIQQRLPWACPPPAAPGRGANACHRALVLGAGPVGLLGAMALATDGFETFVYSRGGADSPRGRLVREIGGTFIEAETTPVADLPRRIGAIDVIYEATGVSALAFDALAVLGPNGVCVLTGVPGREPAPVTVDTDRLMRGMVLQNQVLLGSVNASRGDFEAAVRDLGAFRARWPHALDALITGRFPLDAYAGQLLAQPADAIKNVLTPA